MTIKPKSLTLSRYGVWRRLGFVVVGVLIALAALSLGRPFGMTRADTSNPSVPEAASEPFWVASEAGITWKIFGLEMVGKILSPQTNGAYSVVISTTPPQGGPPLHVHDREDELFYILNGTYEFRFGDETITATTGDFVHLPAHIPHTFRNIGTEPGMAMNTMTPGGFEQFFAEVDQLPKDRPLDRVQVAEIAARYGLQFLPESPS
ncbi:MAG: cupin domain-containing protein [Leptolyngbyaceae cyanobacterium SM2_5_2]|nr:cupin domain-containing protein [Leptolyngbyaceae cyanobacterium SM2_5_2]